MRYRITVTDATGATLISGEADSGDRVSPEDNERFAISALRMAAAMAGYMRDDNEALDKMAWDAALATRGSDYEEWKDSGHGGKAQTLDGQDFEFGGGTMFVMLHDGEPDRAADGHVCHCAARTVPHMHETTTDPPERSWRLWSAKLAEDGIDILADLRAADGHVLDNNLVEANRRLWALIESQELYL